MHANGHQFPFIEGRSSQYDLLWSARRSATARTPYGYNDTYLSQKTTPEIVNSLEEAGLTLSNEGIANMSLLHPAPMYGSFNTQFGRVVSRCVNYPQAAERTFEQGEGCLEIMAEIQEPVENTSEVTKLLMRTLREVGRRGIDLYDLPSDIPVEWGETMRQREASCHYSESRYIESFTSGTLQHGRQNDISFWEKTHGEKSFLNLQPLTYKGIELPAGWVFAKKSFSSGRSFLYPVRPSAFHFSLETSNEAFRDSIKCTTETEFERFHDAFHQEVSALADGDALSDPRYLLDQYAILDS